MHMPETQESIMPSEGKERSSVKKALNETAKFLFPLRTELPKVLPKSLGPAYPEHEDFLIKARKTAATYGTWGDIARYAITASVASDLARSGEHGAAGLALVSFALAPDVLHAFKSSQVRKAAKETVAGALTSLKSIVRR